MMKRIPFLLALALLAGCASDPVDTHAYCQRWAHKYAAWGDHPDPGAYKEDLMSTCMAMKKTPYERKQKQTSSAGH